MGKKNYIVCVVLLSFFVLPIDADVCDEWREHVTYWRDHGGIDWDPARGEELGEKCFGTSSCALLKKHDEYWKIYGEDRDPVRRLALRTACDVEDPCAQLEAHNAYWAAHGGDRDPIRREALEVACTAKEKGIVAAGKKLGRKALDEIVKSTIGLALDIVQKGAEIGGNQEAVDKIADTKNKIFDAVKKGLDVAEKFKVSPHLFSIKEAMGKGGEFVFGVPEKLNEMYATFENNKGKVTEAINQLDEQINSIGSMRAEVKSQKLVPSNIKEPVLRAIDTLTETLPKLRSVLNRFDDAINRILGNRKAFTEKVNNAVSRVKSALEDRSSGKTLEENIQELAEILKRNSF